MTIAVIPARGGSRRIPGKNIKSFWGKPILAYAIEAARASKLFQHIVVSTDDEEVARVALQLGAEVPFLRPRELSDDQTGTDAVFVHAVEECQKVFGLSRYGCCIYPANPFVRATDLEYGLRLLIEEGASSSFPVVRYDFPIEQALTLVARVPMAKWPGQVEKNSQDFPEHFHDAGSFYWFDIDRLIAAGGIPGEGRVAFPIPAERCQDINTPDDWVRAEIKFRVMAELAEA